ncbi:MAG: winged helix-turn-helix domain-containing protein [Marinicella sp.]|nr:winged helix-turn-helix domain-containing protein [Xanthomonadales bacterium]
MPLNISPYQVDDVSRRVLKSGQPVKWGEKASALFILLLEHSPQTISKEVIFEKVWQGRVVTENSLYKIISKLRQELNQDDIEIESVFGEGYRLINNKNEQPLKKTKRGWLLPLASILLMGMVTTWWVLGKNQIKLLEDMKSLQQALVVTKQAFISQINRRNELGDLLGQRFTLNKDDSWEKRFYQLYDQMNEHELFLCQQTRAYTEGPLYENNLKALNLLKNNPAISNELPQAMELMAHLTIWINKYQKVFQHSEKMCLLYVGVEDGASYPSEFDAELDDWISRHQ